MSCTLLFHASLTAPQQQSPRFQPQAGGLLTDPHLPIDLQPEPDYSLVMESQLIHHRKFAALTWSLEKRFIDYLFSLLVLTFVLLWLVPLVALLIKLDSRGPIFFRQLRTGKDGFPFYCLKFRSMHVNTESDSQQACRQDRRVTRIGRILRKTSIDELPQFFNVLRGEMSVVGPRPHMLQHTAQYNNLLDNFMVRHAVAPGITGWAQVIGYRGETKEISAMAKRLEADLWYLENWSILLDIKIMLLTVLVCIKDTQHVY